MNTKIRFIPLAVAVFLTAVLSHPSFAQEVNQEDPTFAKESKEEIITKDPTILKGGIIEGGSNRIIIKYKNKTLPSVKDNISYKNNLKEEVEIQGQGIKVMTVSKNDNPQEVVDRLKAKERDNIEFVEVDALVAPDYIPNDPMYPSQWHLTKISAPKAWDTTKGAGVTVAVLDSGVNCNHRDLRYAFLIRSCVSGWNVVSNNSDYTDINGHGTAVAGTIVQSGNNYVGSAGIAYEAKVMPIRVTNNSTGNAYWSDIAAGIIYAADRGVKIASASYGVSNSDTVQYAANYLRSKGGLFVASAGNDNAYLTYDNSPAIITVGATDENDSKAYFSNFGTPIDVTAPGVNILTTSREDFTYTFASGTSFSAPLVAGVLALEYAANPNLTNIQAENILFSTVTDILYPSWDKFYGWGRINAEGAVASARSVATNVDTFPPTIPTNLKVSALNNSSVTLTWSSSIDLFGVTGYKVERTYGNTSQTYTTNGNLTFTDTNVVVGATYIYRVKAFDAAGNVSNSSDYTVAVIPSTAAQVSFNSSYVGKKTGYTAEINWETNVATTGYILFGTSLTNLNNSATDNLSSTVHTVNVTGLSPSMTYYYKIISADGKGTSSAITSISSFRTFSKGEVYDK